MNTFNKRTIDLEISCIEMTFAHIRITNALQLNKLITALDTDGQLVPVIVVPGTLPNHFTLIDGYLRINALKKLRKDMVQAEIWECTEAEALLSLLAGIGQRHWEVFEEAQALRELQTTYQLSHEQIAKQIGRSRSWISHRLGLLEVLPDQLIQAVMQGHISAWSAQRILVPVARATPAHAECLLKYLSLHSHSTRELSDFFKHYQKTNQSSRQKMVMEPELFFKSQKILHADIQAKLLRAGPEGKWCLILATLRDQIKHLEQLVPALFYDRQEEKIRQKLLEPLMQIQNDLHRISITSRGKSNDRQDDASNYYHVAPIRQELPTH